MAADHLTPEPWLTLDAFLLDAQSRNLSPRTLKYYRDQLGWFFDFLAEDEPAGLAAISPLSIRRYLISLQTRKLQPASQHAAARALRVFFNFCVTDGWLETSPMARVRMPKVDEKIQPAYTVEEVQRLLVEASRQRDRTIVLCLLDSGCRASEFLAWNVEDVNIKTGTVWVRKTKNRNELLVYLGTQARRELLRLYREQSVQAGEPVWRAVGGSARLGIAGLQIMLRKLGERSGVEPCGPHRFRRTFALWSLRNGMNIFALQRIMGHSDLTVLRRYLALVEADLHEAHAQFGAVDHMLQDAATFRGRAGTRQ